MLVRLSQWKSRVALSCTLVAFLGCSLNRHREIAQDELLTTFPNKWFSVNKEHSLVGSDGKPVSHLLFDTTPEFSSQEKTVNVVLSVAKDSAHSYAVDLNSGQRFFSHSYCKQKDVWNRYPGKIFKPGFAIAYVPRVLDQLGDPQKVIVFSNRKNFSRLISSNFLKVKLIAAYVEQICPEGNCIGKNNWLSRLVFVAIDPQDKTLNKISTTADFKKRVNWERIKAILGNLDGRNAIGDTTYPNAQASDLVEYEDAFDYFNKRSIFLTNKELGKIQAGCHALYNLLWSEVGKERPEDRPAFTIAELSAKVKLREALKKEKKPVGFAARFRGFTSKYFREISTCEKFVYHGNINDDRERFWFMSYVAIYYRLHREGYYYNCRTKSWQRNVLNDEGTPVFDITRDISECKEQDFDTAMDYIPNFLGGLRSEREYFRFIDYDNFSLGTHQKLYSWVKVRNRKYDCSRDPNPKLTNKLRVFPEDVSWKPRYIRDIAEKEKIIY